MQAVLRPMNLGEILDRTFEIYRKRFLLFAGIAALPAVLMLALHLADITWLHSNRWFGARNNEGSRIAGGWLVAYFYYHISGLAWLLFQPAFVCAASRELFAESNSIRNSLRLFRARWRTYLWGAFLRECAQLIAPEILAIGLIIGLVALSEALKLFTEPQSLGFLMFGVIALLFAAFLWIGISFAFSMPAAALERLSGWKSMGRSWWLTKKSRWRIFVAWIMAVVCALVLEGVSALFSWWIAKIAYTGHHAGGYNREIYLVVIDCLYALVAVVVGPLYPIAITLLYYDQRSRKEGYDIECMMEAAGLLAPATAAIAPSAEAEIAQTAGSLSSPEMEIVPSAGSSPAP